MQKQKKQHRNPYSWAKVLFVWGGWKGHESKESVELFGPWMRSEGADVVVSDTLDSYLDESLMESLDLIVQIWTMGKISKEQEKTLLKAVKEGVELAGWHGGIGDSFRDNVEYQFMVGGQWVAHPRNVIDYQVKVLATTEFYGEHASWIDGCVVPAVWKKY